jgi:hypothetical protein
MIVIVVLSVVVVRRKEPPLSSTDNILGGFQAEDHFENSKNTCNHKNSTFQKNINLKNS